MTSMELFELLGSVRDSYVLEAHGSEAVPAGRISLRKILLVAAIIALSLLLVGCTYAYVQGWFTDFFAARSEEPLSSEQVEYIQENEQIIQQTQTKSDWTVELKSGSPHRRISIWKATTPVTMGKPTSPPPTTAPTAAKTGP